MRSGVWYSREARRILGDHVGATELPLGYPGAGEVVAGKYRIDRLLGEGGMGAVARATHLITRAPIALKFMSPAFVSVDGAVERFLKESEAAGRIRSEHVVQIFDVDKLPSGAPYIAMECLDGVDLQHILDNEGKDGLVVERAVYFVIQILRGLQVAHAAGIVHRDMKPSNCFVISHGGEPDFVKILDFGISRVSQPGKEAITRTNTALGTPLYMAPEQASNPKGIDHRADLYAVGTILYELLTGHTPYHSETGEVTEILFKIFTTEAPSILEKRPDLSDALAKVVHHALAKKPEERLPTALAFAEALEPFGGVASQKFVRAMRSFVPPRIDDDPHAYTAPMEAFRSLEARASALPDGFDAAPGSIPRPGGIPRVTAPIRRGARANIATTPLEAVGSRTLAEEMPAPQNKKNVGIAIGALIALGAGGVALWISTHRPAPSLGPSNATGTGEQASIASPATAQMTSVSTKTVERGDDVRIGTIANTGGVMNLGTAPSVVTSQPSASTTVKAMPPNLPHPTTTRRPVLGTSGGTGDLH